jgi:hypothetical protein
MDNFKSGFSSKYGLGLGLGSSSNVSSQLPTGGSSKESALARPPVIAQQPVNTGATPAVALSLGL